MNDDEIRLMREEAASGHSATARLFVDLADEALARGAEIARQQGYREEDVLREAKLHERVAQLEAALRWYAATKHWACDAHSGYCDADLDRGEKARAALAAGKP